jgi:hypothetical protein
MQENKWECCTKCALQLEHDSTSASSLQLVVEDLDLTKTPMCLDMPNVGAKNGGVRMLHFP